MNVTSNNFNCDSTIYVRVFALKLSRNIELRGVVAEVMCGIERCQLVGICQLALENLRFHIIAVCVFVYIDETNTYPYIRYMCI